MRWKLGRKKDLLYEERRFEKSWRGRWRHRRETAAVNWFLGRLPQRSRIVDVPCGMGRFAELARRGGHPVCAIDFDAAHARHAAQRLAGPGMLAVHGNALKLPLRSDAADAALCVRLTHHFPEERVRRLLQELARVAPEILLTYYNANAWKLWRKRARGKSAGRRHPYTFEQLRRLAYAVGLEIMARRPRLGFFFHPCQFVWLRRRGTVSTCQQNVNK